MKIILAFLFVYAQGVFAETIKKRHVKTTSYSDEFACVTVNMWQSDAETSMTLLFKEQRVGTHYQCWDHPEKFDCNLELLSKVEKILCFGGM